MRSMQQMNEKEYFLKMREIRKEYARLKDEKEARRHRLEDILISIGLVLCALIGLGFVVWYLVQEPAAAAEYEAWCQPQVDGFNIGKPVIIRWWYAGGWAHYDGTHKVEYKGREIVLRDPAICLPVPAP